MWPNKDQFTAKTILVWSPAEHIQYNWGTIKLSGKSPCLWFSNSHFISNFSMAANWLKLVPFNETKYHANLMNWYLDSLNPDIGCPRLDLTKTIEGGAYVNPKLAVKLLWGGRIYRRKAVWCPLHILCVRFPSLHVWHHVVKGSFNRCLSNTSLNLEFPCPKRNILKLLEDSLLSFPETFLLGKENKAFFENCNKFLQIA